MTVPAPTAAATLDLAPHPTDHAPHELDGTDYDVIVLGAGPAGENVADYVQRGGLSAVVVEAELVGGECSYWACMPSKALLRSVEALDAARAVAGAVQAVTGELDAAAVLERRDSFTSSWKDDGQVEWLAGAGLPLVRGAGRLVGSRQVEVRGPEGDSVTLTARHAVVVATGSKAALPPIEGLAEAAPWTSREATSARQAPRSLVVLGGGVVAVEMATAWSSLGAEHVTVLERGPRLLGGVEPEAGERLAAALVERGIDVRTGVEATAVHRGPDGRVTVQTTAGSVEGDEVLVAAGRTPRTDDIGLETVGLTPGHYLSTDDSLLVEGVAGVAGVDGVDTGWLYACGDANGRVLLTHQGKYQARACAMAIVARARGEQVDPAPWTRFAATADHRAVPQVVFTDPQVASVGLTEAQAREQGFDVRAVEYELGSVAGAALRADGYAGWAKLVVDAKTRTIVGATFLGADVAELVHAATVAVVGEVPVDRLWHAVPSYPTINEVWLRLLDLLFSELELR